MARCLTIRFRLATALVLSALIQQNGQSQATNYTPLFTNSTFVKTVNVTLPVGTVAASMDAVNGAAAYTIPIVVPPGTNGVAPQISINYNSLGGNGAVGQGWSISGLSVITRSLKSLYYDGAVNPVDFSANDRFALDGVRLIGKTGTYGASGATYGTESENFATVTSNGSMGGGPQWFQVVTKDGVTMEYGNTTDSRFLNHDNTKVLLWRLNKIRYNDGNYIEFKYTNVDRDSRIDEINYTGNATTGLSPYNKLKFNYSIRSDVSTVYETNASLVTKYLLDNITITAESGQAFKTYSFKYGFNNISSFLNEVTETGSNGTSLNSTIFKYGDAPTEFQTDYSNVITGQNVDIFSGDFDGDGYSDIMAATCTTVNQIKYHTEIKVYKRTASSSSYSLSYNAPLDVDFMVVNNVNTPSFHSFMATDFTGDGQDDIMTNKIQIEGAQNWRKLKELKLHKSTTNGSFAVQAPYLPPTIPSFGTFDIIYTNWNHYFPGDYNGDGMTDYIIILSNGTGYKAFVSFPGLSIFNKEIGNIGAGSYPATPWVQADYLRVLDFDGDGKHELMIVKNTLCEIFNFYKDASSNWNANKIYSSTYPTKDDEVFLADFNGDRKTDLLSRNGSAWKTAISTGTAFVQTAFYFNSTIPPSSTTMTIGDFDGNGKTDIVHVWPYFVNLSTWHTKCDVYYSRGNSFYSMQHTVSNDFEAGKIIPFDLNGDGRSDIIRRKSYLDAFDIFYFKKEGKEHLLQKVKNGVDHTTEWSYKRMTEAGTFYNRGSITDHPLNNVQLPLYLVYEFKSQNGIGGNTTVQYAYEEAKMHKQGKGFLGLKKVTVNNLATGMKTITENQFNTTFYAVAPDLVSTYLASNNTLLYQTDPLNEFISLGNNRFWFRVKNTYENRTFEGRFISSDNTFDTNGNITSNTTNNNGVETILTNSTYGTFGTPIPAKPTSVTVSRTRSGQSAYAITTTFGYNTLGQMTSRTDFSGLSQNVVTTYGYNSLGNQTSVTVTPASMTARSTSFAYDTKGRFILTTTNPLGQTSTATYDPKWGKPLTATGINGLTTTLQYDAFGRLSSTTMPEGYTVTDSYGWDINTPEGTIHYHLTTHLFKPDVKTWYDLLDREKKTQTEGFQSQWITTKTTYDARGNIATSTAPYKSGETQLVTTNTYDTYNRLTSAANTIGTTTYTYAYSSGNLTTTVTNPASQVSSKVTDATGKAVSATDYGGTLTYTYFSHGNLKEVKLGTTVMVTNQYDAYARQTQMADINAGTTQYAYNALGEMTSQTNANGQTHSMLYDLLGRNYQRTGPEGTTTYEFYPTGTAAANQVKKITGFTGNLEEFTYDSYGRVLTLKETIDGVAHTSSYTYNTCGDVTSTAYPSGFTLNAAYDANGYLSTLKNGNNTVTLFANTAMNGFNQYTSYSLGNGKSSQINYYFGTPTYYSTSGVQSLYLNWNYQSGNLNFRNDGIKSITETFTYDNLNRLLSSTVSGQSAVSVAYAANGNISSKTSIGSYTYSAAKINAVDQVSNPSSVVPGAFQTVSYTAFLQPATVNEGIYNLAFTYGADYERRKTVLKQNNVVTETRYFFAGGYEKRVAGATTQYIHYINNGQGLNAIVVRENGTDTYYYTYTDHLGSILTVTNSAGAVVAEQNFDAWGRTRNPANWTYTGVPTPPAWLYRGFTGHEHLPQFSLINMNGRLYDPLMARMLSVDNYIQSPFYTQNYNSYSYVLNNPLRYTDPSGEFAFVPILIGMAIGAAVHTAVHLIANDFSFKNWDWGSFIGSVVAGGVGGAIAPALAAAGIGGFYGGAVTGAATGFSASLTTGIIHGDSFEDIIASSFKGALLGAAIGGVIGGIDATIKGQQFWDGKGKVVTERYLLGDGNTPEENYYYTKDRISEYNEVASDKFSEWNPDIPIGFEGDLQVTGIAYPENGETFKIMSDGEVLFSTTNRNTRFNLQVPSSNKNISWGVYGNKVQSTISNTLPSVSSTLQEVVVTANRFNSYLRIVGNHRAWAGFLFW